MCHLPKNVGGIELSNHKIVGVFFFEKSLNFTNNWCIIRNPSIPDIIFTPKVGNLLGIDTSISLTLYQQTGIKNLPKL